jgi:hypothetical protein
LLIIKEHTTQQHHLMYLIVSHVPSFLSKGFKPNLLPICAFYGNPFLLGLTRNRPLLLLRSVIPFCRRLLLCVIFTFWAKGKSPRKQNLKQFFDELLIQFSPNVTECLMRLDGELEGWEVEIKVKMEA